MLLTPFLFLCIIGYGVLSLAKSPYALKGWFISLLVTQINMALWTFSLKEQMSVVLVSKDRQIGSCRARRSPHSA